MNVATKEVRHGTSSGSLCLRVGKNFDCSTDKNFISNPVVRGDFEMITVPSDGSVQSNNDAIAWCKTECASNAVHCSTFWFQEWQPDASSQSQASSWKCGFYQGAVDASLHMFESDQSIASGCVCDVV